MSINKVLLTGNLTRDPELRRTASGSDALFFGIAVNDRVRNSSGEWQDRPNFVDCALFRNRATAMSRILRRGMKVSVEGKLHYNQWESNGEKRSKLTVWIDEIELMSAKPGTNQDSKPLTTESVMEMAEEVTAEAYAGEDIPF